MTCTEESFLNCVDFPEAHVFPVIDDHKLGTLCGNLTDIRSCIVEHTKGCDEKIKMKAETRERLLDFLCNEGLEGYKISRPCLANEIFIEQSRQCNATFAEGIMTSMNQYSTKQRNESMCKCLTTLITCIRDNAIDTCGKEPGEWIYQLKLKFMQSSMNQLSCEIDTKRHIPAIVAISVAVLIALVVILLFFVLIYKKIKSEDDKLKKAQTANSVNRVSTKNTVKERQSFATSTKRGSEKFVMTEDGILLSEVSKANKEDYENNALIIHQENKTETELCLHDSNSMPLMPDQTVEKPTFSNANGSSGIENTTDTFIHCEEQAKET